MIKPKNPIKMSKIGKRIQSHWSWGLSSYLIGGWNPFSVSLSTRILILNSIERQIILDSHWFMKDKEVIDWRKRFPQLPLYKENKFKERAWKAWVRRVFFLSCVFFKRGREWVCEKRTSCYVWKYVVHGSKCVQTKEHERKLCVTNSCNEVHEMISMSKPLDS